MSTVYVVQEPLRRIGREYEWRIPRADLEPFGNIVCVFNWSELRDDGDEDFSEARCAELYHRALAKLSTFSDADYLVPLGSPVLIAMAFAVAVDTNDGRVRMLDWCRDAARYRVAPIDTECGPPSRRDLPPRRTPR